jgi:hypothetical protein
MPKSIPNDKTKRRHRFKMTAKHNGNGNGHIDHASRVKAATAKRDDAWRDLFACLGEHHTATIDALTAMNTAAGMASGE